MGRPLRQLISNDDSAREHQEGRKCGLFASKRATRRRDVLKFLVSVAIGFLIVLVASDAAPGQTAMVTLTEADNGKTIELGSGTTVVVRLSAQFGTGYSWSVTRQTGHALNLARTYVESREANLPGGPEEQVFVFRGIGSGSEDVELAYRQPWQQDQKPAKIFGFRAIVP